MNRIAAMKDLFSTHFVLQRKRFAWIDYARGICIILVVYRHCFEGLTNTGLPTSEYTFLKLMNVSLFSFRMPLFFLISGIFVSQTLMKKSFATFVDDRFKLILYPLLIWGSIQITLQLAFHNYVNANREPMDYLNLLIRPRKIEQFWYLNALFMVSVVYAFFKAKLKLKLWTLGLIAVIFYSAAAAFFVQNVKHHSPVTEFIAYSFLPDFLHFFIYFFIGDLLSSFIMNKENQRFFASLKIFVPVLLIAVIVHYFFTVINLAHNADIYVEQFVPALFLLVSVVGCALMIQVTFILQRFNILRFLRVIGYHSLHIYVSHLIVISGMRTIFLHILHISNIPLLILVSVLTGVLIPVLMYNILVRLGFWWLYTLKKPKDEINYYHSNLAMTN